LDYNSFLKEARLRAGSNGIRLVGNGLVIEAPHFKSSEEWYDWASRPERDINHTKGNHNGRPDISSSTG
jgi:hypothetical protein